MVFFFSCRFNRLGFGFGSLLLSFFSGHSFSCASCDCADFSVGCVGSACEGVVAFAALPYANAFAVDADKAAVWAPVWFFEFSYHSYIAFSYG